MKRFIAISLCLLMIVALVGCGSKKRQPIELTLSTEDAEAILNAAGVRLPDAAEAAGANTTVQWFGWGDPFQNYDEGEIVNTGFWTFKEKYNCTLEYIETTYEQHTDALAALITAATPPDCMTGGSNATAIFPMNCIKGMFQPVDPWINFDDPLWAPTKDMADYFTLGGKHYQIVMDTAPANVVVYNRRVIDEYGYDDPAELYLNDDWTWDKFYNMCLDFSDADANRFALDGWAYTGMFMEAAGQQMLYLDIETNRYYSNVDSPEIERGMNYLTDLQKNDCTYHEGTNRWALRNNGTFGAGIKEGDCLFYVIGESFFQAPVDEISAVWGDIANGEIMFAPLPRDEQGDGNYYISTSFDDIKGAIGIISGAENPEGAALLAACVRFKVIDPTVIAIDRRQLQEKYLWSDDMIEMSEICAEIAKKNVVIDVTGNLPDQLQNIVRTGLGADGLVRVNEATSWAQLKEKNLESFQYYLDDLNAEMARFD